MKTKLLFALLIASILWMGYRIADGLQIEILNLETQMREQRGIYPEQADPDLFLIGPDPRGISI